MRVLIDTNILGRLAQPRHALHPSAASAVDALDVVGHELRLVPQVIYEFWAIATRPKNDNGLGFSVEDTQERLRRFKLLFPPLRDERGILEVTMFPLFFYWGTWLAAEPRTAVQERFDEPIPGKSKNVVVGQGKVTEWRRGTVKEEPVAFAVTSLLLGACVLFLLGTSWYAARLKPSQIPGSKIDCIGGKSEGNKCGTDPF